MTLQDDIEKLRDEWNRSEQDLDHDTHMAAGLKRNWFMIELADLPKVALDEDGRLRADGVTTVNTSNNGASLYRNAAALIALALHVESRESEAAALQARRDELAARINSDGCYDRLLDSERTLIDDLIAAEAEVARLKAAA